jgi:DNA-binding transcriptional MerR regulator
MPDEKEFLSISELAEFSRVTRATLLHYDKLGLIAPVSRAENNYRRYSDNQIGAVNFIRTLQKAGLSLSEIRVIQRERTPDRIARLFGEQTHKIDGRVAELIEARAFLLDMKRVIEDAAAEDEYTVKVVEVPEEHILIGPENDYSRGRTLNDALLDFYRHCRKLDAEIDPNYSAWGIFYRERIKAGDFTWPDRFYFNNPRGGDVKPAGLYAIGFARGNYGETDALYKRLTAYIGEHGLEICGPAYETYPLNELVVSDPGKYLIRISIAVKRV